MMRSPGLCRRDGERRLQPRNEAGFTLLEMLVAISVLSIAALALVRLDAFTVKSTADLDSRMVAQIVAANTAADLVTDPGPLAPGPGNATVANGGQNWTVNWTHTPTADPSVQRIEIMVTGADGARARLTTVKLVE